MYPSTCPLRIIYPNKYYIEHRPISCCNIYDTRRFGGWIRLSHQVKVGEIISQLSPLRGASDRDHVLLRAQLSRNFPPPITPDDGSFSSFRSVMHLYTVNMPQIFSGSLIKNHATKTCGGMEAWSHVLLPSALDGDRVVSLKPRPFYPQGKSP
jgi:hypothetical protein